MYTKHYIYIRVSYVVCMLCISNSSNMRKQICARKEAIHNLWATCLQKKAQQAAIATATAITTTSMEQKKKENDEKRAK